MSQPSRITPIPAAFVPPVIPAGAPNHGEVSAWDFSYIQHLLRRRAGFVLEPGKEYLVETRLAALAQREGFTSVATLLESLHTEEEWGILHGKVVDVMMITETSFFRDIHPFEALRVHIIPELLQKRAQERSLQIWCAACASGQEPYSIAMLLREHFPQLSTWNLRIIASDVSESMVERARLGIFSQIEINRGLPAALLVKYFEKSGQEWRLRDAVRRMVEFRTINLAATLPALPLFDIVLLRNVLIYFDIETRRTALANIARFTRPDGLFFLGGGETMLTLDDSYQPIQYGRAISYRRKAA